MTEGQLPLSQESAPPGAIAPGDPPYAPPRPIEKPTNVRYMVLGWACSLSMLTYVDRVCIKQVGDEMQADLGLSNQQFAWVFSAFALSYALLEVPSGWLGDRYGARQVLCRIVLWWSFFTALTGLVPVLGDSYLALPEGMAGWVAPIPIALILLVAVRFLFGAGEAGAYPNASRALRNWFPYTRRGFAQGLLWTFGRWGGAIAPMMIAVYALPWGWRGAFVLFGVTGAIWVIFFSYFFRNSPAEHPGVNAAERALIHEKGDEKTKPPISWLSILKSRSLWFLCAMYLCSNAGWCFFITWDVKYYDTVLNLKGMDLRIASGAPLFFGGVACLVGGLVTDVMVRILGRRWGRTLQGFASYLLGGCFFLLALTTDIPWLAVSCLCIASFFKDFAMAVSWATTLDIGHRYSGTVSGFMNMVGNLGTVIAPPVVAHYAKQERWDFALYFSASMFFTACVCWLFINPRKVIVYDADARVQLKAQGVLD